MLIGKVHKEGLSGKVTFEQSPEGSEGTDHKNVLKKTKTECSRKRNSLCEGPEAGGRGVCVERVMRGAEKGNGTRLYRALVATVMTLTLSGRGAVGGKRVTSSNLGCIAVEDKSRTAGRGDQLGGDCSSPDVQSWALVRPGGKGGGWRK